MSIYQDIADQADQCRSCEELQRLAARSLPQLNEVLGKAQDAAAALAGAQELLTLNPTSLVDIASYIGKLKQYVITPYLAPYQTYLEQIPQITAGIALVTSRLNAAADRIGNCSI